VSFDFTISAKEQIERLCQANVHMAQLPLYRAAADRRLGLIFLLDPAAPWPKRAIARMTDKRHPVIVLVGADSQNPFVDRPAAEWLAAPHIAEWERGALVHGAGGQSEHYREAVADAERDRKFVLVECAAEAAQGWTNLLAGPRCHVRVIVPRDGAPHPVTPPRRTVQ
jgi:hypothetical protein